MLNEEGPEQRMLLNNHQFQVVLPKAWLTEEQTQCQDKPKQGQTIIVMAIQIRWWFAKQMNQSCVNNLNKQSKQTQTDPRGMGCMPQYAAPENKLLPLSEQSQVEAARAEMSKANCSICSQ